MSLSLSYMMEIVFHSTSFNLHREIPAGINCRGSILTISERRSDRYEI